MTAITEIETRVFVDDVELRAQTDEKKLVLVGRLVPYNKPTTIGGMYTEEIAPSCFAKSIREAARRLPLMERHNRTGSWPLGSADEWDERSDGLWGQWLMAGTEEARKAWQLVDEGHLSGMSPGFRPIRSEWTFNDPPKIDHVVRREAQLAEASLVPVGAYPDAMVFVRTGEGRVRGTPHLDSWRQWLDTAKQTTFV